jgi:hypothetical protein
VIGSSDHSQKPVCRVNLSSFYIESPNYFVVVMKDQLTQVSLILFIIYFYVGLVGGMLRHL